LEEVRGVQISFLRNRNEHSTRMRICGSQI
jgi:hypothetical protein